MSTTGSILATAGGLVVVAFTVRDIFEALVHPEGRAKLGAALMRAVWLTFRRLARGRPQAFPLAGPMGLLAVITCWAGLLVLGWALILWPQVHDGFRFEGSGQRPGGDFLEAMHLSLVALTTLGFGDLMPSEEWLRVVAPLEALLGFGLLSASVSWLLLINPVLARRRSLAYEVSLLVQAERETGVSIDGLQPEAAERVYGELASRLVAVEQDLVNFPASYYFPERDARFSLPAVAPALLELAERGAKAGTLGVRLRAEMLLRAIEDLGRTTAERFHRRGSSSVAEALRAYAADHLR